MMESIHMQGADPTKVCIVEALRLFANWFFPPGPIATRVHMTKDIFPHFFDLLEEDRLLRNEALIVLSHAAFAYDVTPEDHEHEPRARTPGEAFDEIMLDDRMRATTIAALSDPDVRIASTALTLVSTLLARLGASARDDRAALHRHLDQLKREGLLAALEAIDVALEPHIDDPHIRMQRSVASDLCETYFYDDNDEGEHLPAPAGDSRFQGWSAGPK
jgi:hypothetical protein